MWLNIFYHEYLKASQRYDKLDFSKCISREHSLDNFDRGGHISFLVLINVLDLSHPNSDSVWDFKDSTGYRRGALDLARLMYNYDRCYCKL